MLKIKFRSFPAVLLGFAIAVILSQCTGEDFYVPRADLTVTSASVSASVVQPNETITLTCTVKNEGGLDALPHYIYYYISDDNDLDSADYYIDREYIEGINRDEVSSITKTLTIPGSTALGTKYILFVADGDKTVNEGDEDNNVKNVQISVVYLISSIPYTQDFESFLTCSETCNVACILSEGWSNGVGTVADWIVDYNGTPSSSTGPSVDTNPGSSWGNYLYVESSNDCSPNIIANLYSPSFDLSSVSSATLKFSWHMYGSDMGSLVVRASTDGGITWSSDLFSISGNQGDVWNEATINLSTYVGSSSVEFKFVGTTGIDFASDMAIDNFRIQ